MANPRKAKIKVTDVQEKNGIYIIGVEVKTYGFPKFKKAFRIEAGSGKFDISEFKKHLRTTIEDEIKIRNKMKPLVELKKVGEFNLDL